MTLRHITVCALVFAGALCAAQSGPESDPRLQAKFTADLQALSMADLMERLSAETGVSIKAGNSTAGSMVILAVKDKMYGEVLRKIAEQFDYTWEARGEAPAVTWMLVQTTAQAKAEKTLREKQELDRMRPIREAVKKAASLSGEEEAKLLEQYRQWKKEQPKVDWMTFEPDPSGELPPEVEAYQTWAARPESGYAERLQPDRRAVAGFLAGLDDDTWRQIGAGATLSYCTTPRRYQGRLPSGWVQTTREWVGKMQQSAEENAAPPGLSQVFREGTPPEPVPPEAVAAVTVLIYSQSNFFGGDFVNAALIALDPNREPIYNAFFTFGGISVEATPADAGFAGAETETQKPKDYANDPILSKKVEAPQALVALGSQDEGAQIKAALDVLQKSRNADPLNITRAPHLMAIAAATGVSLISDGLSTSTEAPGFAELGALMGGGVTSGMAGNVLDAVARRNGQAWELKNGWITMRAEQWAFLRPRQLPREVVRDLILLSDGKTEPAIDDLAEIVGKTNEMQFSLSSSAFSAAFVTGASGLVFDPQTRAVLRLWRSLSQPQKNVLLSGGRLLYDRLPTSGRDAVLLAIQRQLPQGGEFSGMRMMGFGQEPGEQPARFPAPPDPFDWAEYVPQRTPFPLGISLEARQDQGFFIEVGREGRSLMTMPLSKTMIGAMLAEISDQLDQAEAFGVKPTFGRMSTQTFTFHIHLTDAYALNTPVTLTQKIPGSEFDPRNPPDDVKRLRDQTERDREGMGDGF